MVWRHQTGHARIRGSSAQNRGYRNSLLRGARRHRVPRSVGCRPAIGCRTVVRTRSAKASTWQYYQPSKSSALQGIEVFKPFIPDARIRRSTGFLHNQVRWLRRWIVLLTVMRRRFSPDYLRLSRSAAANRTHCIPSNDILLTGDDSCSWLRSRWHLALVDEATGFQRDRVEHLGPRNPRSLHSERACSPGCGRFRAIIFRQIFRSARDEIPQ